MFSKHRIEGLSDAVFAIVMTLLILDIKVPIGTAPGQLRTALLQDAPAWLSFAITFLFASIYWVDQHHIFELTEKFGLDTVVPTFAFLAFVSVLPFSTSLWGHYLTDPTATSIYFCNQSLIAAALLAKLHRVVSKQVTDRRPVRALRFRLGLFCFAMALIGVMALTVPTKQIWVVGPIIAGLTSMARRAFKVHSTESI